MADEKGYNGWTNYETWNVALWISNNEQGSSVYWEQEIAEECYTLAIDGGGNPAEDREEWQAEASRMLANRLKDYFEEASQEMLEAAKATASVWADLVGAALSEVNWDEIATNYISELDHAELEADVIPVASEDD